MGKSIQKKDFHMKNLIFLFLFSVLHTIFFFLFTAQSIKDVASYVSARPQIFALNGVVVFVGVLIFYGISGHVKFSILGNGIIIFLFALINRLQIIKAHRPLCMGDFLDGFSTVKELVSKGMYPDLLSVFFGFFFLAITFILLHPLHFKPISFKGRSVSLVVTLLTISTLYFSLYRNETLWDSYTSHESQPLLVQYNEKGALYGFLYTLDKRIDDWEGDQKRDSVPPEGKSDAEKLTHEREGKTSEAKLRENSEKNPSKKEGQGKENRSHDAI